MRHSLSADFALIRKLPEHNRGLAAARIAIGEREAKNDDADADVLSFKVKANHGEGRAI